MVRAAALAWLATAALAASPALGNGRDVLLVSDAASVEKCERLAEVRGSSALGGLLAGAAYNRALAQMKKRAAKAGATHLLLLNASSGMAGSNMLGIAYRCPPEGAQLRPAA